MEQLQRLVAEQQKIIAFYNPGTWGIPPGAAAPLLAVICTPAVECSSSLKRKKKEWLFSVAWGSSSGSQAKTFISPHRLMHKL